MARYLEGLKATIKDRIGVQVLQILAEAKNMALKAELMLQDRKMGGFIIHVRCMLISTKQ